MSDPPNPIAAWLRLKRRRAVAGEMCVAMFGIGGGLVVLALMAAILLLVSFFYVSFLTSSVRVSAAAAAVFTTGVFVVAGWGEREDYSNVGMAAVNLTREFFHTGPKCVKEGLRRWRRGLSLGRQDIALCAAALEYLAASREAVLAVMLIKALPGTGWKELEWQLRLADGILVLRGDRIRVTLTQPLRLELRRLLPGRARPEAPREEPAPAPAPVDEPGRLGPADVLGVASGASAAEIKAAYRRRMKECHPDRFAGADSESQRLAEEWTKAVNAAYESLMSGRGRA